DGDDGARALPRPRPAGAGDDLASDPHRSPSAGTALSRAVHHGLAGHVGIEVDTPEHVIGRSIDAGIDAVMVTSHIDRQLAAAGWIERAASPDRVREALDRVSSFRERFATGVPDDDIDDEPARALAAEIAERSITHVGAPLPRLDDTVRVTVFIPGRVSPAEELSDPVGTLERALRNHL